MSHAPNHRLLLVDDEPAILDALETTLSRAKDLRLTIASAASAKEALARVERESFDLVIADHRMPGMTGVELLEVLRERAPETVRVLLTGHSDLTIAMDAMERARVQYFVRKPWSNDELRALVGEALASR